MGWKNLKERFRIGHTVQVTQAGICIGSAYHDIIVVGNDGVFKKRYGDQGYYATNPDLLRYQQEMDAAPADVLAAINTPDQFSASLTVWTYSGSDIIKKHCEQYGWPNLTHDGLMMWENTYFVDREEAVKAALRNSLAGLTMAVERVAEIEEQLARMRSSVAEYEQEIRFMLDTLRDQLMDAQQCG